MDSYYRRSQKHFAEKKKRRIHWWIFVVIAAAGYAAWCLFRPLEPIEVQAVPIQPISKKSPSLPWPAGAESAIGSLDSGVLATSGPSEKVQPTASVAKLITALTVLSEYPLGPGQEGPTITLTDKDVAIFNNYYKEDGSLVEVKAGEQLSEHQALEAMLIPSANNMADSLATWAFGSLAQYRLAATKEVQALGMKHTTIGPDASGFNPGTTSTPSDLIKLGQAVMSNSLLAQIVSEETAVIPVAGTVQNTNYLLGTSGIIGIKTGNSGEAGGNLLFSAKYSLSKSDSITIIGAIMHAPDLLTAMKAATPLLVAAENNFKLAEVVRSGQAVANFTAPWLTKPVPILTRDSATLPVWRQTAPSQKITLAGDQASSYSVSSNSIKAGATVGKLSIGGAGNRHNIPLISSRKVGPPSIIWRLAHPY